MTPLGERLMEWLQSQPDVSMVRDASTVAYGDGVQCQFGGVYWFIALEHGGPSTPEKDPREVNEKRWMR